MIIVGERINTSRKPIDQAVSARDASFIREEVKAQVRAGAHLIDVNAGSRKTEVEDLLWLVDVIQENHSVRLCLDSSNPGCLLKAVGRVKETPMINSISAERRRFEGMIPVIQMRECEVVALCMDDRGVPKAADQVLENVEKLLRDLEKVGVKQERIYFDPVIQAVSTDSNAAVKALNAIERIHREFPGTNTICGLSNISYALPKRQLINRAFMGLAIRAGLSAAIIDPLDRKMATVLLAISLILGKDPYCKAYLRAFREGRLED